MIRGKFSGTFARASQPAAASESRGALSKCASSMRSRGEPARYISCDILPCARLRGDRGGAFSLSATFGISSCFSVATVGCSCAWVTQVLCGCLIWIPIISKSRLLLLILPTCNHAILLRRITLIKSLIIGCQSYDTSWNNLVLLIRNFRISVRNLFSKYLDFSGIRP